MENDRTKLNNMSTVGCFRTSFLKNSDLQGFWYFAEKKEKFCGIFKGKFAEKLADFAGYLREKVKIRRKIGWFSGILAEKSQILKDFQGQVLRKIGRFHGKFRGENFAKKQSVKNSRFRWIFFWQISLKSINFASIWAALFNNISLEKWANGKASYYHYG